MTTATNISLLDLQLGVLFKKGQGVPKVKIVLDSGKPCQPMQAPQIKVIVETVYAINRSVA